MRLLGILSIAGIGAASVLTASLTLADSSAPSVQNKEAYELQERCAKDAAALFAEQLKDHNVKKVRTLRSHP